MIIVRFQGALGNQICQYAMYKRLEKMYPNEIVKADLTIFSHDIENPYRMDSAFKEFPLKRATRKEIYQVSHQLPMVGLEKYTGKGKLIDKILRKLTYWMICILRQINKQLAKKYDLKQCTILQDYTDYSKIDDRIYHLSPNQDCYINGTWYNCNIDDVKSEVIKLLQFKEWEQIDHNNKKLLDQIKKCNSVSVHIRRGNYVAKGYLLVDEAYYRAAIDYMIKNVKEPHFFVFSDEIACAKEMFKSYDQGMFTYVSGNDGINSYKDMQLMSNCNNNIIANSTFSLCATFLNKHPNITIVPKVWSKGGVKTWENSKWIYL